MITNSASAIAFWSSQILRKGYLEISQGNTNLTRAMVNGSTITHSESLWTYTHQI